MEVDHPEFVITDEIEEFVRQHIRGEVAWHEHPRKFFDRGDDPREFATGVRWGIVELLTKLGQGEWVQTILRDEWDAAERRHRGRFFNRHSPRGTRVMMPGSRRF